MMLNNIIQHPSLLHSSYAKVIDNIFIGNIHTPSDTELLIDNRISLVVNCSGESVFNPLGIKTMELREFYDEPIVGTPSEVIALSIQLYTAAERIACEIHREVSAGNGVLVHCQAGVNRSAYIIAVYLRIFKKFTAEETIRRLRIVNITRGLPALVNLSFITIIENIKNNLSPTYM